MIYMSCCCVFTRYRRGAWSACQRSVRGEAPPACLSSVQSQQLIHCPKRLCVTLVSSATRLHFTGSQQCGQFEHWPLASTDRWPSNAKPYLMSWHLARYWFCRATAVVRRPSVRPSVCPSVRYPSRSCVTKRVKMFSNILTVVAPLFFFPVSNVMAIFRRRPPNWGKNRDFRPTSDFGIDDWRSVECH